MGEKAIRFGVANSEKTLRAATWKCWTSGGADKSVYLTCREVGQQHTSLHQSGHWHTGFDSKHFDSMFEEDQKPPGRFMGKWEQPPEYASGWTWAASIYTPLASVVSPIISTKNITWLRPPSSSEISEVDVWLGVAGTNPDPDDWPGKTGMGTQLVGRFQIEGAGQVVVLSRFVPPLPVPATLGQNVQPRLFKGVMNNDLVNDGKPLNAILSGQQDGRALFYDARVP